MSDGGKPRARLSRSGYADNKRRGTKRKRREGVDLGWDEPTGRAKRGRPVWAIVLGGIGVVAAVCLVIWVAVKVVDQPAAQVQAPLPAVHPALEVAQAFLAAGDEYARLGFVRRPEVVRGHLDRYSEQARSGAVEDLRQMGHRVVGGVDVTAYAARFADGGFRMLSVVDEGEGPLVDWDSYARYCSAPWDKLFSGAAEGGEVRVFVRPGEHFGGSFLDPERWACFLLETPDFEGSLFAYAPAGSDLAARMQSAVMATRAFRQHLTLRVRAVGDGLFEVEELLAVGWVVLE